MLGEGNLNAVLLPSPGGERSGLAAVRIKHLLRTGVLMMAVSSLTVFALAVSLGQQTAWPLMNISQYAAQYPGVYFFRTGTTMCAAAMLLIAYTFGGIAAGTPFGGKGRIVASRRARAESASTIEALARGRPFGFSCPELASPAPA